MIKTLIAIGITTLGGLSYLKPSKPIEERHILWEQYKIRYANSDESVEILSNSYFYKFEQNEYIPYPTDGESTKVFFEMEGNNGTIETHYENAFYFLVSGYPEGVEITNYNNDLGQYLTTANNLFSDGSTEYFCLNIEDFDDWERHGIVTSFADGASGYAVYGIAIPKEIVDDTLNEDLLIYTGGNNHTWELYFKEGGSYNERLTEPVAYYINDFLPFNDNGGNNYRNNDLQQYQRLLNSDNTGSAYFIYGPILKNNLFLNTQTGIGNNLFVTMYNGNYPNYLDYRYDALRAIWDYTWNENYLEEEYTKITDMKIDQKINRMAEGNENSGNPEYEQYRRIWVGGDHAKTFVLFEPNATIRGESQKSLFETHIGNGGLWYQEPGITIGGGYIGDVFDLIGKAFSGIGSFFYIALIPGITLGTLIVTPLVISLLLWLISLFKRH